MFSRSHRIWVRIMGVPSARILAAIADRIEPDKPSVEIQYVYVYSAPPVTTQPVYPAPYWQQPWTNTSPNICSN